MIRFDIRDLEQFTGVKAHTIRIWEKRYGLLAPERSSTNIRSYGLDELKSIMNVAFLNQRGYKISRIAAMSPADRERLIRENASAESGPEGMLNDLVLAMLAFDEAAFNRAIDAFAGTHGFRALVERVLIPLLERIGVLWQSSAVCPAQEHFVSNIIRKRLIVAAAQQPAPVAGGSTYVLFLPENEIHELGLLYIDYLLRSHGHRTIYLGQSVPSADLKQVAALCQGPLVFVGIAVVQPQPDEAQHYVQLLRSGIPDERATFMLAGGQFAAHAGTAPAGVSIFPKLSGLLDAVSRL